VGHLEIGDIAVVVAVGAVHRGEALAACAHLINTLKAEVPIWKEQHFASGGSEWVGLPSDEESAAAPGTLPLQPVRSGAGSDRP
jgi:molybdopterin synthase catalytic subunit